MDSIRLGQMVRFHRRKARLTQAELAKMTGIGKTTIFDLEKGKTTLQLCSILSVFRVLNIDVVFRSPLMRTKAKLYLHGYCANVLETIEFGKSYRLYCIKK